MTMIAVLLLPFAGPLPAPLDTLVDVAGYHLHMPWAIPATLLTQYNAALTRNGLRDEIP